MTGFEGWTTSARERLSVIADGEADDDAVRRACAQWRDQPAAATLWRDYHLIGDVLRSDDLASDAAHDAQFLEALRGRLALEPTVLAPPGANPDEAAPASMLRSPRRSWVAASAVAAGFMAVAGVLVVTRAPDAARPAASQGLAQAGPQAGSIVPASASAAPLEPALSTFPFETSRVQVATDQLIRDARLDQYLKAHQQFSGTSALGAPSAFLRSATSDASNR